jgi:heme-degrading monooxygenase HmoA
MQAAPVCEVRGACLDDAVRIFGEAATEIEGLAGFAGGFVFVDQEDGRTMTVTLWDNTAALENSEPTGGRVRRKAAEAVGGSVLSIEKFEVAHKARLGELARPYAALQPARPSLTPAARVSMSSTSAFSASRRAHAPSLDAGRSR